MTAYRVEIIAVGTELLLGNVANTDAQFLSEMLASVGVDVLYHTAVGDNPARLREVVDIARGRANLLVFTGGLGPTYDDMTKQIVCEAFGLGLEFHPEIVEEIRHYFDAVFLSYELHELKPSEAIFRKMIAAGGMRPEETLFIDDGQKNVDAAQRLGFAVYMPGPGEDFGHILDNLNRYEEIL